MREERSASEHSLDAAALRASLGVDDDVLADVRAVGAIFSNRVPELVDSFYEWLTPLPEFAHFFTDDTALLSRVKSHQIAYWRDFLKGTVDGAYVERRRLVGQVHARIELGLMIYLRAMEFVSSWLTRAIAEERELSHDRPSAAASIRRLVQFDSAIVVDTYAVRTARALEGQRERLGRVAEVMRSVTEGDLGRQVMVTGPDDVLGRSVNEMIESLRDVSREMRKIAEGDYSADPAPRSARDEIGASLREMTRALRGAADRNERYVWISTTLAELGTAMSGNPSVDELSSKVLRLLCRAVGAPVGAQYLVEHDGASLRLAGTFAVAVGHGARERWRLGEGLVGQVALDRERVVIEDVPDDAMRITWGLGEATPRSIVVLPLVFEGELRGVMELGSLGRFDPAQLELLDRAASSVAVALSAAAARARIQQLLEESRSQAEELTLQQETLREVNAALEEQREALQTQKESLLEAEVVLKEKAIELERASRYKSEFLANMSHELRTPLNSTLILAKLLAENREGNLGAHQIEYARSIYAAGNDLLALINDILDLSKIEAGKVELRFEEVSTERLVGDLRHRFEAVVAEKGLELVAEVAPGCPPTLETDPHRLQQVLTNLLSNAIKFTERGAVRLRASGEGAQVVFAVEDTGVGIAAEHHALVFEAFRQADGTVSRQFGGTGLGLSICRELVSLLGGAIELRSAPGQGSVFTVRVPARFDGARALNGPGRAPTPSADTRGKRSTPSTGLRRAAPAAPAAAIRRPVEDDRAAIADRRRVVLVVEDDAAFAGVVRDAVREVGFSCVVAGTAAECLRLALELVPTAIILDIGLPGSSGLACLELLKREPTVRHVPVHVVSVHDYGRLARERGAVSYLQKPIDRADLMALLREVEARASGAERAVLVVEDDPVQRAAIVDLLRADGVVIVAVATAEEALSRLASERFDCMVLDLMLPGTSGFELLERMPALEPALPAVVGGGAALSPRAPGGGSVPVIVYTARSLDADEEHRLRRRSRSIIVKGARSPERLLEEVTLFLHQAESDLTEEKQRMLRRARETAFAGRRILLVEDDVRNVFALTSLLEPTGATVDIARNGLEALSRLDEPGRYDVVLMDVMMPEMDGLAATRAIRARGDGSASVPIIALTAKAMPDDRDECLDAGANDYVAKPIDGDQLMSLLRVWMPQ